MIWEHFEHGADVGVRGIGATPSEAFEGAAAALAALVHEDLSGVRPEVEQRIVCEADDLVSLLVRFLNELISRMSAHRLLYGDFSVSITRVGENHRLSARVRGEPLDLSRHEPTVEPKGATFTAARVAREDGAGGPSWVAQCVVDV